VEEYGEVLDTEEQDLGISPLGMLLVVICGLVAFAIFIDPQSEFFDMRIAGMITLSIVLGFSSGLQRWGNEPDIKGVMTWGLIGAAIIGIVTLVTNTVWTKPESTVTAQGILVIALPAVFEELLFRGGVFLTLLRIMGVEKATVVQAIFFAIYHSWVADLLGSDLGYFICLIAGGIVLQIVFLITKNILTSMISHAINNLKPFLYSLILSPLGIGVIVIAIVFYIIMKVKL